MLKRWRIVLAVRRGDWQSKLLLIAQLAVVAVALLAVVAMLSGDPVLLLAFSASQPLLVGGVVLFVIVAVFAQRTMVLEVFDPNEIIFREGEPGRHVYVVKSGEVDVLARRHDGSEHVINRLRAGDHFGEMALIRRAPRTATVRAVTAVEVFKMGPSNFAMLYTNLPGIREHFGKAMAARLAEFERRREPR